MSRDSWKFIILLALLLVTGCRQQAQTTTDTGVNIDVRYEPEQPAVGDATLLITVTDAAGSPINAAQITARGDMNHAGMVPVIAEADSGENGVYTVPFEWTMSGDWFLEVTVTLPDGTTAAETFDLRVITDPDGGAMDMEMPEATENAETGQP